MKKVFYFLITVMALVLLPLLSGCKVIHNHYVIYTDNTNERTKPTTENDNIDETTEIDPIIENSNVEIGTISTASLEFDAVQIVDNKSFNFGGAKGDHEGRITCEGESFYENLSITVIGLIKNAQYLDKCTAKLTVPAGLQAAVDKKYIVLPECAYSEVEIMVNQLSTDNSVEFAYTIDFAWGEAFGCINPTLFFDSYEATDANGKVGRDYTQEEMIDTLFDFNITMFTSDDSASNVDLELYQIVDNNNYQLTLTAYCK